MSTPIAREVANLPNIGDAYDPVCLTGCAGLNSHAIDFVWWSDILWTVLCFSNSHLSPMAWHVVAVIPEDQMKSIVRWWLNEAL